MTDEATAYARAVVAGQVVAGRLVRLACERHLRDLAEGAARGLRWDVAAATRAIRFFADVLRLNGGEHEGRPFVLEAWQAFIVGGVFGWKGPDGYRRFRTAYIETAKGNGKSPLAAGVGLYCLTADGESRAEVYAAATKRDQAMILFRDAVAMVDQSPALGRRLEKSGARGKEWNLAHHESGSFFRAIGSDENSQSGPRPAAALVDEVHEHKTPIMVDMMRAGTKGRRQALIFEITNSGHDRTTVCWAHHELSVKVLEGLQNDSWFAYVSQLDPCEACRLGGQTQPKEGCADCDDWRDEKVWPKANPNLGVSISLKYLREQVEEAKQMPSKEGVVKRLNFCIWTEGATKAIPMDKWDACKREIDKASLRGRECFGGLDIGATSDFTAWVLLFPGDDAETVEIPMRVDEPEGEKVALVRRSYTLLPFFWLPQHPRRRDDRTQAMIDGWRRLGLVRTTPGEVVDYDLVLRDILALSEMYPLKKAAVDHGFQGSWLCTRLMAHFGEGAVEAVRQGIISMNAPFREWVELVIQGRLHHDGNQVLRWMAANTAAETQGGLVKPSKDKSGEKIDGVTAGTMALAVGMRAPPEALAGACIETWG